MRYRWTRRINFAHVWLFGSLFLSIAAIVLLAIAGGLIFIGLPNKAGVSPRFLQFDTAVVLYPPLILVFIASGFAELTFGFLHLSH